MLDTDNVKKGKQLITELSNTLCELSDDEFGEFIKDGTIDLFLKSMVAISPNMTDLILNHRHYNLALIFITRRPQSIPTEIVESCENIFCFKIEGENVERKLKAIHPDFQILLPKLDKEKYNFLDC